MKAMTTVPQRARAGGMRPIKLFTKLERRVYWLGLLLFMVLFIEEGIGQNWFEEAIWITDQVRVGYARDCSIIPFFQ